MVVVVEGFEGLSHTFGAIQRLGGAQGLENEHKNFIFLS